MRIVETQKQLIESLFIPIDGQTADGYVIRRALNYVDVWVLGKEYRINRWLVWCKSSKQEDGTILWQHACLDVPWMPSKDAARALSKGRRWIGKELAHTFIEP